MAVRFTPKQRFKGATGMSAKLPSAAVDFPLLLIHKSSRFDNNTWSLLYAVHHGLEGPVTKKFISGLPCAATPTVVVNNQDAVRDDQIIKMLQLMQCGFVPVCIQP